MAPWTLTDFVRESNRIEGITREPTSEEVSAHFIFSRRSDVLLADLVEFVRVVAPHAVLRDRPGLNVRVGDHIAPPGSPYVAAALNDLLLRVNPRKITPWHAHVEYETLHPFTDGNGRSGRALWLWMMRGQAPLGFLHQFYYQTLAASSPPAREGE